MSGTLVGAGSNSSTHLLLEFTQGIDVDARLAAQEVAVQKAWARGLGQAGILSAGEVANATAALTEALELMNEGRFEWRVEDEDIHMNLERFLTERHGALGKRIHLGRSRNDLIATTLRLFARDQLALLAGGVRGLGLALASQAEATMETIVPGLTHLQHGQPVRFGHVLASHGWALARDLERLAFASRRAMERMPLGAAALAGTTLSELDLDAIAQELGFQGPAWNSYDAVGDRDFLIEAIDASAGVALHLSRLSEDFIIWSSTATGLVRLPPDWSTGSSIMPNKRNPDVPELIRAKSAHVMGAAANAHMLVKAVPTSYGSDLHELKGVAQRAFDELAKSLVVFTPFVRGIRVDAGRAGELLARGHVLATEIADELAREGLPFREAYARVATLVEQAEAQGVQVEAVAGMMGITPETAVERRSGFGGTARARALEGLTALRKVLG